MNQGVELVHEITQVDIERLAWEPIRVRKKRNKEKKRGEGGQKKKKEGGIGGWWWSSYVKSGKKEDVRGTRGFSLPVSTEPSPG